MKRTVLDAGQKSRDRGSTFAAPRKPIERKSSLERVSSSKSTTGGKGKRSGPISPASKEQREKAKAMGCLVTGHSDAVIDPAHLAPRGAGASNEGGCDAADCIVGLRRDLHRAFDDGDFDLLGSLLTAGRITELQHALGHYGGDVIALLERLTNRKWVPTVVEQHPLNIAIEEH